METLVWAWAVASARQRATVAATGKSRHRGIRMGTLLSQSRSKRVVTGNKRLRIPVETWPIGQVEVFWHRCGLSTNGMAHLPAVLCRNDRCRLGRGELF